MRTLLMTAAAVAVLLSGQAIAQVATATASATMNSGIALAKNADMSFGAITPGGTDDTVIMTAAGVRSAPGGSALIDATLGTPAAFTVTGVVGALYETTLPTTTVTLSGPGGNIDVTAFTSDNNVLSQAIPVGGTDTFKVGATLEVPAGLQPGAYTGAFNVSVNYN